MKLREEQARTEARRLKQALKGLKEREIFKDELIETYQKKIMQLTDENQQFKEENEAFAKREKEIMNSASLIQIEKERLEAQHEWLKAELEQNREKILRAMKIRKRKRTDYDRNYCPVM